MSDESAPEAESERGQPTTGAGGADRDAQIRSLTEIVGMFAQTLRRMERRVNQLTKKPAADTEKDLSEPAAWVWFTPPAAAENDPDGGEDPRFTVENFVGWYNVTFVGVDGSRARSIPPCWRSHPGVAMEVAALAYSWRAANIGPEANSRDAQAWLHQWRPGFSDRLTRDWVRPDCLDGDHRDDGSTSRADRFTLAAELATSTTQPP
ncbi:hypothetical protein [Umezawaea sp. Da 62-37]|uniref:hypothetical protein n=1 Tax=Umezawaea sp. Da 62-37 TaxID=3075927 RepID=UPI0028F6CDDB|nr:hypothetical protein [Umezawaea sp. Da 62-37]WNV83156.1 hypothetical protein RM788_33900 [Umezawaea sp. Da 62-37]